MEFIEISAKTVNDAITEACQKFTVTSDKLEYEVVEEGSSGFLGIGAKPAIIKARVKSSIQDTARDFLKDVFEAMDMTVVVDVKYDEIENSMEIELSGDDMGVLIGKRGQTLDSDVCSSDLRITVREGKKPLRIWQRIFPIRLRGRRDRYLWSR